MSGFVRYWSMERFTVMIVSMLLNKFDCFIAVEGNRGLGKSSWSIQVAKRVHNAFRNIQSELGDEYKEHYRFNMKAQLQNPKKFNFLMYKQEDALKFFNKWHVTGIADEMINVAFNRDFMGQGQKDLIKIINMNRDHGNLFFACVPQFQVLDNQIKNLCKIRITIVRRGLAVIQTPNRTIYNRDKWDATNNERIEREWLRKGGSYPQYSKLNTFRGMLRFAPLSKSDQSIYDMIKTNERNIIAKDQFNINNKTEKEKEPEDFIVEKLLNGGIRNSQVLDGMAFALKMNPDTLKAKLRRRLIRDNKSTSLTYYYTDKKAKEEPDPEFVKNFKKI